MTLQSAWSWRRVPGPWKLDVGRPARALAVLLVGISLSGCLQNAVREIRPSAIESVERQGVIVYGVGVERAWPFDAFSVDLAKVDPASGKSGDCFRYDRAEGEVPTAPGATRYFAFAVPAGYYTYAALNGAELREWPATFKVEPGQPVYGGDYILVGEHTVARRDRQAEAERAVGIKLKAPEFVNSKRPRGFLCTL